MNIRKAQKADISAIETIFEEVHGEEESGRVTIGWQRGIYPTRATAEAALERDDIFVLESGGEILGAAVINQLQVDVYAEGKWRHPAGADEVMVLHTLVISPAAGRRGLGRYFVSFYEEYARQKGCLCLRIDTNERNVNARALYKKLGYEEIGIVPCVFNGLEGVNLVLLEKYLGTELL